MHNEALKMLRKEKGFTQAEMAEMLEVSRQSYIAWENGRYQIPADIEKRLADGGIATKASQKFATKTINRTTHPQCFLAMKGWYWTLAHPFWFASSDCPLSHKVPDLAKYARLPTLAEYEAHVPLSPETVFDLMVHHGADRNDILRFMIARGYRQFGEPVMPTHQAKNIAYNTALAQWNAENPDAPGWSNFEQANPQYREQRPAMVEPTQKQIEDSERTQRELNDAFKTPNHKE